MIGNGHEEGLPKFQTWLQSIEEDLQTVGIRSAWRKAAVSEDWRRIVNTATLSTPGRTR